MKEYTRELKKKAIRDSLVLDRDVITINELKKCGYKEEDILDRNRMRDVWEARKTFTTTSTQKRIIRFMLDRINRE